MMLKTILKGPREIELTHAEIPNPQNSEVRIKLTQIGVCGSDIRLFKNGSQPDSPLTIGHEGVGVIDKLGEGVKGRSVGERVVIEPNIPCRDCPDCWSGKGNICRRKRIIGVYEDGAFAEYIVLPESFAHNIPDNVSDEDAVVIEPTAVVVSAIIRSKAKPGDSIVVIGLGGIGLLLTHVAISLGYRVFVSEIVQSKIDIAVKMGAILLSSGKSENDSVSQLEEACEKEEVVTVFECAGSNKTASLAIEMAPRGAEIILLGLSEQAATFKPLPVSRKGNHIIPSLIYDHPFDFKRTIRLISSGRIKPGFIISNYFPLEETQRALELAANGDDSKVVINLT